MLRLAFALINKPTMMPHTLNVRFHLACRKREKNRAKATPYCRKNATTEPFLGEDNMTKLLVSPSVPFLSMLLQEKQDWTGNPLRSNLKDEQFFAKQKGPTDDRLWT